MRRRKSKKMMFFFRFLVLWLINFLCFEDNQLWNEEIESSVGYNWICAIEIVFVNLDSSCALMRFNVAFEAGCNKLLRFIQKIIFYFKIFMLFV